MQARSFHLLVKVTQPNTFLALLSAAIPAALILVPFCKYKQLTMAAWVGQESLSQLTHRRDHKETCLSRLEAALDSRTPEHNTRRAAAPSAARPERRPSRIHPSHDATVGGARPTFATARRCRSAAIVGGVAGDGRRRANGSVRSRPPFATRCNGEAPGWTN